MKILAIESSCDETAAAVTDERNIISSVVATQIEEHKLYGGVVPEIASRRHAESIVSVVNEALSVANCELSDIEAVAVTSAPGLIGSLLVGLNFAKGLALSTGKPLIPVHHLRSHIAANYIENPDLKPPFLCLVVSGGHSHIVEVTSYTEYAIIGHTHDDAAGECFDKAARALGMPYPGGVHLDKIADNGNADLFKLPYPKIDGCPYDFSFSGLKTAAINLLHRKEQKGEALDAPLFAARYTYEAVEAVVKKTEEALKTREGIPLVVAGGVAANSHLRARLAALCEKTGHALILPPLSLCGDNGAMIAAQGVYEYRGGHFADSALNASAADDV